MLESKMEALRARAEEVSTGATGDAQAKLLRQIETLQTQYAVASENWQGIETSLVTRVTNLERDKEELTRKEGDIRRKAREINLKSKRLEAGLESATGSVQTLEHELAEGREQLEKLRRRLDESEVALREAQAGFARDRAAWDSLTTLRIEQERSRWKEEALLSPGAYQPSRTESPTAFSRRGPPSDVYGFQSRRGDVTLHERPGSRRTSTQPARTPDPDAPTPPRQDSMAQMVPFPETPSIHTMDGDEAFDAHSSPHRTVADMISGSVGGAGPSVQLVERMSAAVRRLESEKAGHREELARLQTQRDEARTEVVSLMREVEAKRAADERIAALEAEVRAMGARYETTLEMLGEKSELVDELRNDVADVKKIYRELVESTMR
ncbi:MAG: hypothetical protein M1832_004926 [Thelocarpon impressellum]|nr:MAG: hypothetical protein M1832_004926 [Thelocarpon impressellum]